MPDWLPSELPECAWEALWYFRQVIRLSCWYGFIFHEELPNG